MHKKVLLFAPYFPPRRRVGSIRPFRFATHLKMFGWEVVVICIKDSKNKLTKKEETMLEGIKVYEIETPIDNTARKTESAERTQKKVISNFIDNRFPIDTWLPLFWKNKKEIYKIMSAENPDVLWSTGDPWSGNYIAKELAVKFNIPWVADFRDPWTLCNVRYDKRKWPATLIDHKAESKIMQKADHVVFTAKTTQQKYEKAYTVLNGKSTTIYNSFDRMFFEKESEDLLDLIPQKKLNILFLGKFRELSTANAIIDILLEVKKRDEGLLNDVHVYSFGELIDDDFKRAQKSGLERVFAELKPVPNEDVISLCNKFDLLLLSTHPGRDDIVPAKLLEYLISNVPIFSLAPNLEVGEILNRTNKGMQYLEAHYSQATTYIIECIKAKKSGAMAPFDRQANTEEIEAFSAYESTKKLVSIFEELV